MNNNLQRCSITIFLFVLLFISSNSQASESLDFYAFDKVEIKADKLTIDDNFKLLAAKGNVQLDAEDFHLEAEDVLYKTDKQELTASGNVRITDNSRQITNDKITISFITGKISTKNITVIKYMNDNKEKFLYKIEGALLEKREDKSWHIEQASYTACDCGKTDEPSWSISCDKATVSNERSLHLEKPTFRVKNTPVFALPSLTVPLAKRKTGFLMPSISYTDQTGGRLTEEFFMVLDDHNDMTFGLSGMTKKGIMPMYELRSISKVNQLKLNGFYLYDFEGNNTSKADHRYSVIFDQKLSLADIFYQKAKLGILSDTKINNDFAKEWRSRNLDYTNSGLQLVISRDNIFWGVSAEYFQYLFDPALSTGKLLEGFENQNLATVETMSLNLNMFPVFNGKLFVDLNGVMRLYYLNYQDSNTPGSTVNEKQNIYALTYRMNPNFLLPVKLGRFANIGFKAGILHDGFIDLNNDNSFSAETRINLSASVESRIYRIFKTKKGKLKHTIIPFLRWNYAHTFEHGNNVKQIQLVSLNQNYLPLALKAGVKQKLAIKRNKTKFGTLELNIYQRFIVDKGNYFSSNNNIGDLVFEFNTRFSKGGTQNYISVDLVNRKVSGRANKIMIGPFNGVRFNLQYLYLSASALSGEWLFQRRYNNETINQLSFNPIWEIKKTVTVGYLCDISLKYNMLIEHSWFIKYRSPCNCWSMTVNINHRPEMDFPDVFLGFDLSAMVN